MDMKECLEKSAQVWRKPFCSREEMDIDLCKGFAETLYEYQTKDINMEIAKELKIWALKWPIATVQGSKEFYEILARYDKQGKEGR